ncbi:MAG TPA: type VII secretion protein EccCa [Streptosporangiaceae bacterium]|nr:type VII secretion protein EccCa [Streptosporangiaceae bacterium]
MGSVIVRRQERREAPELPRGEIMLEPPPEIPEPVNDGMQQMLTYLPMLAMSFGMVAMMSGSGSGSLRWVGAGGMVVGMGGLGVAQVVRGKGDRKLKLNGQRRDYLRYLGQVRRKVRRAAAAQRDALEWANPDPAALWWVVAGGDLARVWERRPADADFCSVRLGKGTQHLAVRLVPPETKPVEDLDPLCAGALRRFVRAHARVPDLPVGISLRSFARLILAGEPEATAGMVRAMIAQIAVFHSPDEVRICVCAPPERIGRWQWMKWLPHNLHPTESDAAGPVRLMAKSLSQLEAMLGAEIKDRPRFIPGRTEVSLPFNVVIVDGASTDYDHQLSEAGVDGVAIIELTESSPGPADATVLRLDVHEKRLDMITRDRLGNDQASQVGMPDSLSVVEAEALARQLAPLRPMQGAAPGEDALAVNTTLSSLLGIANPEALDLRALWRPRAARNRLRVPIGVTASGAPLELDIKESAQGGLGPHGLVIGATGSGKSELLRTLVLGLATTHNPEALNFVLVDFKGGATFLGLERLGHVSAVITNLEEELPLVDRMRDALHGELVRRQELLRSAGNYASVRDYERDRERGARLDPLPTLFVVLDEFSELLSAKPEFIDLFVMIGRLGRSLAVHLLLASQRLEEGRLRGLDTQLSYRVGLRTFSAGESRIVLGTPDAYELPSQPGNGYLKIDVTEMTRFKAAYVSGPPSAEPSAPLPQSRVKPVIVPYGPGYVRPQIMPDASGRGPELAPADGPGRRDPQQESLFEMVIRQLAGQGQAAHQIWLPPLDVPPSLDELLPPLEISPEFGCTTRDTNRRGRLQVVTGIVDRPFEQRRDPLWSDLSGSAGHVGVAGSPQSGKSTMLRTVISSLALLHTPQEVQIYVLDFGGGTVSSLAGLPHVGGVATRLQAERVRRTVAEVKGLLERREREFSERGIESIAAYRLLRAAGEFSGDGFGDVFLVVDNWLTLRQDYEQIEADVTALAARGLGYGIHVVAATNKWSEFRPGIRDLFGTRFELRLGDPYESEMGRALAANVPERSPGRGLTKDGMHFLTALPRIDGQSSPASLPEGVRRLIETVDAAWPGPRAPVVRLLPEAFPATQLPGPAQTGTRVPFGLDENTLSPVMLDFSNDPHFVVFGDTECGKSNLLRVIAEAVVARQTPEQARLIVIDYRRSLLDVADTEHRIGYAASSSAATALIADATEALVKRLPPADLTPAQLRSRSWWSGSDLYLIVDDYDLVTGLANPLQPLIDLIPQARDIGLHVVLARSAGGSGRAMFEPVLQRLREMGSPALVMSGNKDEGVVFGVKPQSLPPGRGYMSSRRAEPMLMQVALADEGDGAAIDGADTAGPQSAGPESAGPGQHPNDQASPPAPLSRRGRHSAPRP